MDINDIQREAKEMSDEELAEAVKDLRARRRLVAERKSPAKRAAKPKAKTVMQKALEDVDVTDIEW
jgi:hypothetical protein